MDAIVFNHELNHIWHIMPSSFQGVRREGGGVRFCNCYNSYGYLVYRTIMAGHFWRQNFLCVQCLVIFVYMLFFLLEIIFCAIF